MLFCKHKWEVTVNSYDESPNERMAKLGFNSINGHSTGGISASRGTRIIILACSKCGKLNKTIEHV